METMDLENVLALSKWRAAATTDFASSGISIEQIRSHVDATIPVLVKAVASLKATRNMVAAINRLPVEVLTEIFLHLPGTRTLVIVTLVCQHWRAVALHCASLWATFSFHDTKQTEEFLKRSKGAPLDISVNMDVIRRTEAVRLLRLCIPRLRSLDIFLSPSRIKLDLIQSLPDLSAPCLESFSVQGFFMNGTSNPQITSAHLPFNGSVPSLKRFKSRHCSFPRTAYLALVRNLVHLEIVEPSMFIGYTQVITFLQQSPLLETFILVVNRESDREVIWNVEPGIQVELPHLIRLTLGTLARKDIYDILTHVSIPRTTCLTIIARASNDAPGWATLLPSDPTDSMRLPVLSSLKTIQYFQLKNRRQIQVHGYLEDLFKVPLAQHPDLSLTLESVADFQPYTIAFPLSAAETLVISGVEVSTLDGWNAMLGGASRVRTLRLISIPCAPLGILLQYLCWRAALAKHDGQAPDVFGDLMHLEIIDADWTPEHNDWLYAYGARAKPASGAAETRTVELLEVRGEVREVTTKFLRAQGFLVTVNE